MTIAVKRMPREVLDEHWDASLVRWDGATLFSRRVYLEHLDDVDILAVFDRGETVALFPVPIVVAGSVRRIARTNYLSPYFPVLFRRDAGSPVRREQRRRSALTALIDYIQKSYESMVLPLHPDLTDVVPLQRAHVQLELRTTYELPLESLNVLWNAFDPTVRNHVRKAATLEIEEDPALAAFDFNAAVFYEPAPSRAEWRRLACDLVAMDCATPLVARLDGVSVGGLLLAYDSAHNLLSYFDRRAPVRGAPSALIWAAARSAAARGLQRLDLEGSVLPSVEGFYQQFGGVRRTYFQVHWHADERCQRPILYRYEGDPD
jgi:hypothetical protein